MAKRNALKGTPGAKYPVLVEKTSYSGDFSTVSPGLEHIWRLLKEKEAPKLTAELSKIPLLEDIHHELLALRKLAEGLQSEISQRNSTVIALQEREYRFRYLATHDSLTGAMNRASFVARAIRELRSAFSTGGVCGMVMMDIDHFKKFNDTWGHLAGDEALRSVVRVVSSILRKNDFMGRYGGEEFVFFFGDADMQTSVAIAERIRETIAASPILLENGPVSITASFGVAVALPNRRESPGKDLVDRLINNADMAMYQAKKTGRNRVMSFLEDGM
jgi:diguanylate cyclase (GGDEF)-like protein